MATKISSLSAGAKIAILETSGYAIYTLVHHNYNSGASLLLRDASIGSSKWRNSGPSSYGDNVYEGSELDTYLTNWYNTLPSSTRDNYLITLQYPVSDDNSGGEKIRITRGACTVSLGETGLSSEFAKYNDIGVLDCTSTLNIGVIWWTRQPYYGSNNVYYVNASGKGGDSYKEHTTKSYSVRPTLGVLENQDVEYSSELGAYICVTPVSGSVICYYNGSNVVPYHIYRYESGRLVQYNLYYYNGNQLIQY